MSSHLAPRPRLVTGTGPTATGGRPLAGGSAAPPARYRTRPAATTAITTTTAQAARPPAARGHGPGPRCIRSPAPPRTRQPLPRRYARGGGPDPRYRHRGYLRRPAAA